MNLNAEDTTNFIQGIENTMRTFSAASQRPWRNTGTSPRAIEELASNVPGKRLGQFSVMTPIRQPILAWSSLVKRNSLKQMDELISSPEGMKTMIEMGKLKPLSQLSADTLATFLTFLADKNSRELPVSNSGENQ